MKQVGSKGGKGGGAIGQIRGRAGQGGGAGAEQGGPHSCFRRFCFLFFSVNPNFFAHKKGDINLGAKSTPEPGSVPVGWRSRSQDHLLYQCHQR